MNWIKGNFPRKQEGHYLVWLSRANLGSKLTTAVVIKNMTGFSCFIEGYFDHDFLDRDPQIVAWCDQPDGPIE